MKSRNRETAKIKTGSVYIFWLTQKSKSQSFCTLESCNRFCNKHFKIFKFSKFTFQVDGGSSENGLDDPKGPEGLKGVEDTNQ